MEYDREAMSISMLIWGDCKDREEGCFHVVDGVCYNLSRADASSVRHVLGFPIKQH